MSRQATRERTRSPTTGDGIVADTPSIGSSVAVFKMLVLPNAGAMYKEGRHMQSVLFRAVNHDHPAVQVAQRQTPTRPHNIRRGESAWQPAVADNGEPIRCDIFLKNF